MYAQSWVNIYDIVAPFPDEELPDLTTVLQEEVYSIFFNMHK